MKPIEIYKEQTEANEQVGDGGIGPCIGQLAAQGPSGEILVAYRNCKPKAARLLSTVNRKELLREENQGREVLLLLEEGEPDRPIIIGLMENPLEEMVSIEFSGETSMTQNFSKNNENNSTIPLLEKGGKGGFEREFSDEPSEKPKEALVDGKRVTIEAEEEVVLKCGAGSITLRKDGKIIIKGTHLLSRSSGPNRIKGGSVQIN